MKINTEQEITKKKGMAVLLLNFVLVLCNSCFPFVWVHSFNIQC